MSNTIDQSLLTKIVKIKMLICDVDGVLTDGTIFMGSGNIELKRFSVIDGAGFFLAKAGGLKLAVISGRYSPATELRVKELPIDAVYNGTVNKLEPYQAIKSEFGLTDDEIAYVGDDLIDIPVLNLVGLPIAVENAYAPVKERAAYVTKKRGGEGAVREVIDLLLEGQQKFDLALKNLRKDQFGEANG